MTALSHSTLTDLCGTKMGRHDVPCPLCGPGRRNPANRKRRVLRIWCNEPRFASFHCVRCGERGWASDGLLQVARASNLQQLRKEADDRDRFHAERQLDKARWLWDRRRPLKGSPAETYLRHARGYGGTFPTTLGFLPAAKLEHHSALIAAFCTPPETEPGVIKVDQVQGVHLTLIAPDGSGKADTDRNKLMIGRSNGWPIALAPMSDVLGLAICEGIETGLSIHEATGLGVWAAGSAARMAGLADKAPAYVDCVTIAGEADPAGQAGAAALARLLGHRGVHCETRFLDGEAQVA